MPEFTLRDIVAPVGKYTSTKDGKEKNKYIKIGMARVSEHGSVIQLYIDATPLNWDGRAYVNSPRDSEDVSTNDHAPKDIDDTPIDLSEIPF